MYLAARQSRFEYAGSIQGAGRVACTHQGVYLVDEQDDLGVLAQLLQHVFHPLLKLPAVHRSGYQHRQIQADDALVLQFGYIGMNESLRQALNDG